MPETESDPGGADSPRTALGLCHRCIAGMLDRLDALVADIAAAAAGTPEPALADRARTLVADLDEAMAVHIADEESDVFPALLAACDSPARRAQAFELVSSLLVEHREMAELWHALRIALLAIGSGVAIAFPGGTAADYLVRVRAHLERENLELTDLMGVIEAPRARQIAVAIAHRHEDACIRVRNCPLLKP
jgi:hypothetical protein